MLFLSKKTLVADRVDSKIEKIDRVTDGWFKY